MTKAAVELTKAEEQQAEKLAAVLVERANSRRAFRLSEWPRVSVVVDGAFFLATPTADSISIRPAAPDAPAWAFLYAQDVQGALAELRKRDTDVVVMAKLQKGSAGRATLATEILESIIQHRTYNLQR
jgi:hypothetical protein